MSTRQPRRLPIVTTAHELSGNHPRQFERLVKSCSEGGAAHFAALYAMGTVAARGVAECLPPSARAPYDDALSLSRAWAGGGVPYRQLRDARAQLFEHAPETERRVRRSMAQAFAQHPRSDRTPLDEHADQVVQRYLGLCLHHAIGAVILVLDGTKDATLLLDVPGEVAGAIAYKHVGLGPARSSGLRSAALTQASWEHRRVGGSSGHSEAALSVQLLHEYLGVHWKNHVDAQRLYLEEFLIWAFNAVE